MEHIMENNELNNEEATKAEPAEPTVNINLTVAELNVTFAALQELPHRVADPIIKKVIQQAQSQLGTPQ